MPLPKNEVLLGMIEKADYYIEQFSTFDQPIGNTNNNNSEGNSTEG